MTDTSDSGRTCHDCASFKRASSVCRLTGQISLDHATCDEWAERPKRAPRKRTKTADGADIAEQPAVASPDLPALPVVDSEGGADQSQPTPRVEVRERAPSPGPTRVGATTGPGEDLPDGVYTDLPARDYHALKRISASRLKRWSDCAAKGMHQEDVSGPDVSIGTAVHAIVEGMDPRDAFVVADCAKRSGKAWDAAVEEAARTGAEAITLPELERVNGTAAAVFANPLARKRIETLQHEVSMLWSDGEVFAKARADMLGGGRLVDLKTTGDPRALGNESDIARLVLDRLWHLQLAWYAQGAAACGIEVIDRHEVIVVSSKPPHVCEVVTLDDRFITLGAQAWSRALSTYRAHTRNPNRWPGASCDSRGLPTVRTLTPPGWAL